MTSNDSNPKQTLMQPVSGIDLDAFILGQHADLLAINDLSEARRLLCAMIDQASHRLIYFGQSLGVELLGDARVMESVSGLFQRNRSASMKTLVHRNQELVSSGHRLVELLRDLMPSVECRLRRVQSAGFEGECILIDRSGYLFFPNPDRHTGSASFNGVANVEKLHDVFVQEWEVAEPDSEIRPLYI